MNKLQGYLIDPDHKLISIVDFDDDSIAPMLYCSVLALGATFPNGDVLYVDESAHSKALLNAAALDSQKGFYVQDFGYLYGKGLLTGSNQSGGSQPPLIPLEEFNKKITFEKDPFIIWYENFLVRAGHDTGSSVKVGNQSTERSIPVSYILNVLSLLPESKKNEIKMMAEIDLSKGLSPFDLLKHFATNLGE